MWCEILTASSGKGSFITWSNGNYSAGSQSSHEYSLNNLAQTFGFLPVFSSQKFTILDMCLQQMPPLHIFTTPSRYHFPETTALKSQNLQLFQNIYATETIVLKVASTPLNLFYWLALKIGSRETSVWWITSRLFLAAPEDLICFIQQHMYKCRSFSTR